MWCQAGAGGGQVAVAVQPGPPHLLPLLLLVHLERLPGRHAGRVRLQPARHHHQQPRRHHAHHRHRPAGLLQLLHQLRHHPGGARLTWVLLSSQQYHLAIIISHQGIAR